MTFTGRAPPPSQALLPNAVPGKEIDFCLETISCVIVIIIIKFYSKAMKDAIHRMLLLGYKVGRKWKSRETQCYVST